jgi:hypothetical protein
VYIVLLKKEPITYFVLPFEREAGEIWAFWQV